MQWRHSDKILTTEIRHNFSTTAHVWSHFTEAYHKTICSGQNNKISMSTVAINNLIFEYDCLNKRNFSFCRHVVSNKADLTSLSRLLQSSCPAAKNEWSQTTMSREGWTPKNPELSDRSYFSTLHTYNVCFTLTYMAKQRQVTHKESTSILTALRLVVTGFRARK